MESTGPVLYTVSTISQPDFNSVKINPLSLFKVCDYYQRNSQKSDTIIGFLFGTTLNKEAFINDIIPQSKDNTKSNNDLLENYKQLYPNADISNIIGWFSFSERLSDYKIPYPSEKDRIHLWIRPYSPPKIDFFAVKESLDGQRIFLPIEYSFSAESVEQIAISRFLSKTSHDSLEAAIKELSKLFDEMSLKLNDNIDILHARQIHHILSTTQLSKNSIDELNHSLENIQTFIALIQETTDLVKKGTEKLSLTIDDL